MADWSDGYVTDLEYPHGYYPELNPLRVPLAFLYAGLAYPECETACELGFGQGVSVNIHAAASKIRWYGTDFNPAQVGLARELAAASGAATKLCDEAFADFVHRTDLPDFDYIGLHGIWTWVSNENRKTIVDFVRRKLKVGGVLYISYNTLPGWAPALPIRDLFLEYADTMVAPAVGNLGKIEAALQFADKFMATNPAYARANPKMPGFLESLKNKNRNYLVHEYLNRNWLPMSFTSMANWLAPARVSYACSANYLDNINSINLLAEQQEFLNKIPDAMFRESMFDFIINQHFRRDYWVKGGRKLATVDREEALRRQKIVLTTPRSDIPLKVKSAQGEAALSEDINTPILDFLADHQPRTLEDIEQAVQTRNISFSQVTQASMVLIGAGHLTIAQDETHVSSVKTQTDNLNAYFMHRARYNNDIDRLASPTTGEGIEVTRFQQLFLLAAAQGKQQPVEWAQFVWELLARQDQKIIKNEKILDTYDENIAELTNQAREFAEKQLPILQNLGVA